MVRDYGGVFSTHWGSRGESGIPFGIKRILESISIAREVGIGLQLSHLHPGYAIYPLPPPDLEEAAAGATLEVVDEAIEEGIDLGFDVIPNTSGGTHYPPPPAEGAGIARGAV